MIQEGGGAEGAGDLAAVVAREVGAEREELGAAPGPDIEELKTIQTVPRTLQSPELAPLLGIVDAEPVDVGDLASGAALTSTRDDGERW